MNKVMFFAHDPGGANAIAPLISEFESSYVFAKGPALKILSNAVELPEDALRIYKPDFLITGTSGSDFTERYLWNEASELGIKSMAILDMWVNYGVRFSEYGLKDLHLFNKKCDYLPDYICVMDELAKEDMINDGVPENIILPFGNPHFEYIASLKPKNGIPLSNSTLTGKKVITFASQPIDDIFRKGSEIIVLEDLIDSIIKRDDVVVLIRKHPKESREKFNKYTDGDRVQLDANQDLMTTLYMSDVIVSVNSMVLIEALFLGKKILSYQPKTIDGKNDFILTRDGTLPFINNAYDFTNKLFALLDDDNFEIENKIPHVGIIRKIKHFLEEQISG
jgi:hypothetical protein